MVAELQLVDRLIRGLQDRNSELQSAVNQREYQIKRLEAQIEKLEGLVRSAMPGLAEAVLNEIKGG